MANEHLNDLTKKGSTAHSDNSILADSANLDIWLTLGFLLIALLSIYLPPLNDTFIRFALGLIMVMLLPGYTLLAAVFPGRGQLAIAEKVVLSVALSIVLVPLLGFALNFTQWGIRLDGIVVSVSMLILIFSIVTLWRRRNIPHEEYNGLKQLFDFVSGSFPAKDRPGERVLTIFVIIAALLMAGTIAYYVIAPLPGEQYTEFYILGPDGKASNYPTSYYPGDVKPVIVGITNHELRNVTYDLAIYLDDGSNRTQLHREEVFVANNQTLEKSIDLKPDRIGDHMKIDFMLYKEANATSPYRELYLWVNVTGQGQAPPVNVTAGSPTPVPFTLF